MRSSRSETMPKETKTASPLRVRQTHRIAFSDVNGEFVAFEEQLDFFEEEGYLHMEVRGIEHSCSMTPHDLDELVAFLTKVQARIKRKKE